MAADRDGNRLGLVASALCLLASAAWLVLADQGRPPASQEAKVRRPVAAAFLGDGRTLCVANHRSGTVSLVDVAAGRAAAEFPAGTQLAGLAVHADGRHVLVVDDERHELVVLARDGDRLAVRARLLVAPYPASVAVQPGGQRATVASLWSRRVEVVDLSSLSAAEGPVSPRVLHTVRLPFAPREQCILPGRPQVVVADGFAGGLAVVDADAGRLIAAHEVGGHNLRGLAVSADGRELLVTRQVLDPMAATTRENVESGRVMRNEVVALPLDRILAPDGNLAAAGRVHELQGAGDPAGVAVLADGQIAVALAGVQEVALLAGGKTRRVAVGRRPTVVAAGDRGRHVVVVNTLDDTLSLLDPAAGVVRQTVDLGPRPAPSYQDRGEQLFFDARLSRGGGMSCHSCHPNGHTSGLLADTSSDGSFGTPKRILTLLNTRMTDPWAWNGGMKYLHDQVHQSLTQTMHAPRLTPDTVDDLTSFLHTLGPPPPAEPAREGEDRDRVERGRRIFEGQGCVRCHIPPLTYSSHGPYDVGFTDERGLRAFNPPSLRGVGQGYRFLHDGRAAKLEEVFTKYRHRSAGLSPDELADLVRFLRSL